MCHANRPRDRERTTEREIEETPADEDHEETPPTEDVTEDDEEPFTPIEAVKTLLPI